MRAAVRRIDTRDSQIELGFKQALVPVANAKDRWIPEWRDLAFLASAPAGSFFPQLSGTILLRLANCCSAHNSLDFPSCYDSVMRDLIVLFIHFIATLARLVGPGGARKDRVQNSSMRSST